MKSAGRGRENMTGKERIYKTMRKERVDNVAWVPFSGVHTGRLTGHNATEMLIDGDKLMQGLMEVERLYKPDGMPIVFDLQIEAEILGCELKWDEKGPPTVISHPLSENKKVPCLCTIPEKTDGRLPVILDVMGRCKSKFGNTVALYGLVCGPFTLASHLRSSNIFMDMFDDEEYVRDLVKYAGEVCKKVSDYYIEAGMDVIAAVDPLISQISPEHFNTFISETYTDIFQYIRSKEVFSSFFVCGDATRNLEVMCQTKPDCIAVDENIELTGAKNITDKYGVVLEGNIPLTTVMLHGTQQDNMKYVVDLLDSVSHENLIVSPGCDMPFDIPPENVIAIQQAIRETDSVRKMLENYEKTEEEMPDIELPDYENLKKPLVEVFTLDSATCAACTYMMDAAKNAKQNFGEHIDVVEYKYTERESIARCRKMSVRNLPSMYIDGKLEYASLIPNRRKLFGKIEETLKKYK